MTQDFINDLVEALHKEGRAYILCVADSSEPTCGFRVRSGNLAELSPLGYGSRKECLRAMFDKVLDGLEEDEAI